MLAVSFPNEDHSTLASVFGASLSMRAFPMFLWWCLGSAARKRQDFSVHVELNSSDSDAVVDVDLELYDAGPDKFPWHSFQKIDFCVKWGGVKNLEHTRLGDVP